MPDGNCMRPLKTTATIADKQGTGDTNSTKNTRDKSTFAADTATNSGENVNGGKDVTTTETIIVATGMMIEKGGVADLPTIQYLVGQADDSEP
jgi:hypothetical protein